MRYSTVSTVCYFTLTISSFGIAITTDFDTKLSVKFLDFAAAAYAENTEPCLSQNNATQVLRIALPCDYMKDECWGIVALTSDWIITSFRGTRTKIQLITELIETMSEPKKLLSSGGSVQHYFYVALKSIWTPIHNTIKKLSKKHECKFAICNNCQEYPTHKIMFTGHSLGGALASLASTLFAHRYPGLRERHYIYFTAHKQLSMMCH
uniref:Lipase_3 domain-containing protein n=1 Tax=Heterorhabditis bacteriophora TaxID=37862 RepID=A0A1I7XHU6_HETBA